MFTTLIVRSGLECKIYDYLILKGGGGGEKDFINKQHLFLHSSRHNYILYTIMMQINFTKI